MPCCGVLVQSCFFSLSSFHLTVYVIMEQIKSCLTLLAVCQACVYPVYSLSQSFVPLVPCFLPLLPLYCSLIQYLVSSIYYIVSSIQYLLSIVILPSLFFLYSFPLVCLPPFGFLCIHSPYILYSLTSHFSLSFSFSILNNKSLFHYQKVRFIFIYIFFYYLTLDITKILHYINNSDFISHINF